MTITECCELCSIFWDCQLKWFRGERGEEQACCPLCRLFYDCNSEIIDINMKHKENKDTNKNE